MNAAGNRAQQHWSGTFVDANANGWNEFAPGDEGNTIVDPERCVRVRGAEVGRLARRAPRTTTST